MAGGFIFSTASVAIAICAAAQIREALQQRNNPP